MTKIFIFVFGAWVVGASVIKVKLNSDASDAVLSIGSCDLGSCNNACMTHGYPAGGICIGGLCFCIKSESLSLKPLTDISDTAVSIGSCDQGSCNTACVAHGYPAGGICLAGSCYCIKTEKLNYDRGADASDAVLSIGSCDPGFCNNACVAHGYPAGGICLGGSCYCIKSESLNFKSLTDISDTAVSIGSCDQGSCNTACVAHGYPAGGICLGGSCYCIKTEKLSYDRGTDKSNSLQKLTSCDSITCNIICLGSGTCIFGTCFCNRVNGIQNRGTMTGNGVLPKIHVNKFSPEDERLGQCGVGACHLRCKLVGAVSGNCVDNECKCTHPKGNNLIDILEPHPCDTDTCKALCGDLNYTDGVCAPDGCRCQPK